MHLERSSIPRLAAPVLPVAVLFGHAEGFSWDEALMVLAPIAVLAGVLLYANHKVQGGFGADPSAPDDPPAAAAAGPEPEPSEATGPSGPAEPT